MLPIRAWEALRNTKSVRSQKLVLVWMFTWEKTRLGVVEYWRRGWEEHKLTKFISELRVHLRHEKRSKLSECVDYSMS